ncbi:MAG TPA: hypothetical protein VD860_17590 [Azospirillum sp.]|nr:hypothetical protein [Azospirillum sp.]
MRDQPLSLTEAAKWLGCTVEEVSGYVADGRLKPFAGAADGQVSLNSVVVLAESLPAERGVFRVRDMPSYDSAPPRPSTGGYGGGPGGFNKPRPAPIVERRPLRPPPRGE